MPRRLRALLLVLAAALALSACHAQIDLAVQMAPDGSGTVTVTLVADAELVAQAPGLGGDLRLDDLRAVGWQVDGPTATDGGGLRLVLWHAFADPGQADALIASLQGTRGPFTGLHLTRQKANSSVVATLSGSARLDHGLAAFADDPLIAALGAAPYDGQLTAQSLTTSDALTITLHASLPGTVKATTGVANGRTLAWLVPSDGTPIDLATTTAQSLDRPGPWHQVAATLHVLWLLWIVLAACVVLWMIGRRLGRVRRAGWSRGRGKMVPANLSLVDEVGVDAWGGPLPELDDVTAHDDPGPAPYDER